MPSWFGPSGGRRVGRNQGLGLGVANSHARAFGAKIDMGVSFLMALRSANPKTASLAMLSLLLTKSDKGSYAEGGCTRQFGSHKV